MLNKKSAKIYDILQNTVNHRFKLFTFVYINNLHLFTIVFCICKFILYICKTIKSLYLWV